MMKLRGISKGRNGVLIQQRVLTSVRFVIAMLVMVFGIVVILSGSHSAHAATTNTANTLKVSPVRSDVEIAAGTSKTVQTVVTNLTKAPITVHPIENDFVSGDESGTPALILDENKFAPTHSLKRFMTPLTDVTVPAGQTKAVNVTITVPKDAQPGGYFGAVRFAPSTADTGGQVNLNASVASLILLSVPGDAVEKLNLTDFAIQQGGKTGTNFNSSNDLQATVRFENKGSIQLGPIGKVSVKEGDKIIYETDFNNKDQRDVILPDSARRWDIPLKNLGSFGHYSVTATFTYGKKNQTIEITKSFWVIPTVVIIAAIVIGLLLIGLIIVLILFFRNRRRRNSRGNRSGGLKMK
jgi:TRAP-type C4-dicarboxylate transport system permease small subunit